MNFEIFGEHQNRISAVWRIKKEIFRLRKVLESRSTEVYNERIPIKALNSLGSVLQEVERLKKRYKNTTTITVKFDGTRDDNVLPVVHIISDDARTGKQAHEEMQKVFEILLLFINR